CASLLNPSSVHW
nr:immunoglobulin heavy chain junction region [Macaca mulatta]